MKNLSVIAAALLVAFQGHAGADAPKPAEYSVQSRSLTVGLTEEGEITGSFSARTELAGCWIEKPGAVRKLANGGYEFERRMLDLQQHRATVTDRFIPTNDSIRWEVEIVSDDAPWSTAIETWLNYPSTDASRFWMSWGDPHVQAAGWNDPLDIFPLQNETWSYQLPHILSWWGNNAAQRRTFSIPMFTFLEPTRDTALTLAESPEDTLLDVTIHESASGDVRLSRTNYRLGGGQTRRFGMDLIVHPADPRAGLGWMVKRYPQFFNPGIPGADQLSGCGAYSGDERPIDAEKLKAMAFAFNWKLSDDFPYMGNFIPVTSADQSWRRACAEPCPPGKEPSTSCRQQNDYAHRMKAHGLHVLSYFNVTEYGRDMKYPAPPRKALTDADLWMDPHDYLFHGGLTSAVLMDGKQPVRSNCYGALVVDPGDSGYMAHILEQIRRNNDLLPDVDGVCIDRTDWLTMYNVNADDGISWVKDKPARSLHVSWQRLADRMLPALHQAGKFVFVNNCDPRLEVVGRGDGIFMEAATPCFQNFAALTGLRKPVSIWTASEKSVTDDYLQRCLHLGLFPTAPYPANNHCVQPSPHADARFLAYGRLMNAIRERKWVLTPRCVETTTPGVKVNLFEVPGGHALPVTFGGDAKEAIVRVRNIPGLTKLRALALHPGEDQPVEVPANVKDRVLELRVPLSRGCAVVTLNSSNK